MNDGVTEGPADSEDSDRTGQRRGLLRRVVAGPLGLPGRTRWVWALAVVVATLLTQIAVVAWPLFAFGRGRRRAWVAASAGLVLYAVLTAFVVPRVAPLAGRVQLPCFGDVVAAHHWGYCVLNRNYVVPDLAHEVEAAAIALDEAQPGLRIEYLDGGFPFAGLPMLPHLSHGDGEKLDLALVFRRADGERGGGSPIGYFGYVQPATAELAACPARWWDLRWDFAALQSTLVQGTFDADGTEATLQSLLAREAVRKILIEPHLEDSLGIVSDRLRFQGCYAARHDDHVHIQL